jgi:hypothetical protein
MISLLKMLISLLQWKSPHVENLLINHSILILYHPQAHHGSYLHGYFGSVALCLVKDNDL